LNFKDMEKEELNKKLEDYYLEIAQGRLDLLSMDIQINNLITPFYVEISRLPLSLRKTIVQDKLIEVNKYIISLAGKHGFYISNILIDEDKLEIEYQDFSVKNACMVLPVKPYQKCFNLGLTMQEENLLHDLLTKKLSENWENNFWVNCPKGARTYIFDIVNYVANLRFYVFLLEMFMRNDYSKNAIEKSLSKLFQFQTNLTDEQRGKLFDLLVENGFIPNINKDSFIWAFGGEKQPNNFEQLEWIDKSTTRREPNMKTFYELLLLLGVPFDTKANSKQNLYDKIKYCFKGFVNIQAKNTDYEVIGNTPRKRLLKKIVDQVTKKQKK